MARGAWHAAGTPWRLSRLGAQGHVASAHCGGRVRPAHHMPPLILCLSAGPQRSVYRIEAPQMASSHIPRWGPGLWTPGARPSCVPLKEAAVPPSALPRPGQVRLGARKENPSSSKWGRGAPWPGGPVGLGVLPQGAEPRKHHPYLWLCGSPPARSCPQPSKLVTKEKHAAMLMQLGKCYFSNAARSSGLNL